MGNGIISIANMAIIGIRRKRLTKYYQVIRSEEFKIDMPYHQDIINERLDYYGIVRTSNLYEEMLWPSSGEFYIDYIRVNSELQIYDVAHQELKVLVEDLHRLGVRGEELYRAILAFYNFEVLTEKAATFLKYVEEKYSGD